MDQEKAIQIMNEISNSLKSAGYDPYEQLVGYLQTGKDYYITRKDNAREKIRTVDKVLIQQYTDAMADCNLSNIF